MTRLTSPYAASSLGALALLSLVGLSIAACVPSRELSARGESPEERAPAVAAPKRSNAAAAAVAPAPSSVARAPDVPYDPSPPEVVKLMLRLAEVRASDVVYDLGCGDGRIVIAAAEQAGARGVCVDIDPERIAESRRNAERAGVSERITFLTQDLFETDLRDATVVMLFLWPKVNLKLRPKLWRELRPGTRVVSHWHDMADWKPDDAVSIAPGGRERSVYLWRIDERVGRKPAHGGAATSP